MPIYKMDGKKDGLQRYHVCVNYTDDTGKKRQIDKIAYSPTEAAALERQLLLDLGEECSSPITLQQLADEYIGVKKNEVRETTAEKNKELLKRYVLPQFGNYLIDKLNIRHMQNWKSEMNNRQIANGNKLSLKYKQNVYSTFSALLNYAVKMEYIATNPLSRLGNFKDANLIRKEMDFYTVEEFKKFIVAAKQRALEIERQTGSICEWDYYIFFMIAFYTGMRKGEINALKWTDMRDNVIYVTRSIAQKMKGEDRETPPKNKSSIRSIQIPIPLKTALTDHYNRHCQTSGFSGDWRVCGGIKCIRDTTLDHRNREYAQIANIKTIRIHDYRHSHASVLINAGINIKEIARRLGHSKVEQTWNTYSHLYPHAEAKALEVLNNII